MVALDALAALVPDGALIALPPDNSLTPAAFARALVRAGRRGCGCSASRCLAMPPIS
jgi:glutaconate CoA-transferase subunit A